MSNVYVYVYILKKISYLSIFLCLSVTLSTLTLFVCLSLARSLWLTLSALSLPYISLSPISLSLTPRSLSHSLSLPISLSLSPLALSLSFYDSLLISQQKWETSSTYNLNRTGPILLFSRSPSETLSNRNGETWKFHIRYKTRSQFPVLRSIYFPLSTSTHLL